METKKVVSVAEKVKSFAIALVGIVFFSWGTDYLAGEHLLYNVPRILLPVFDLFGHVGLAVGLMALGAGLIVYAFVNWKKAGGRASVYCVPVISALAAGIVLANVNFKGSGDLEKGQDDRRETQTEELRSLERPQFKDQDLERHFASFERLYERYERALQAADTASIVECEEEFQVWCGRIAGFMPRLDNDQKYELSKYYSRSAILWNDLQQKNVIDE
ncbi:hypothetical protein FACS1894159_11770 [Bacteroidia bacterium]|nr:hypothetical protein FACS1894159_11770 [Bacteroidia bacterium]